MNASMIKRFIPSRAMGSCSSLLPSACVARVQIRHYAEAKTGQKKKQAEDDPDVGTSLGPFVSKPAAAPLANLRDSGKTLAELGLHKNPRGETDRVWLMRSIEHENRDRYDLDGRGELFDRNSPHSVEPGSVLLVEQVTSRSRPKTQVFAGILIAIRRKGIRTTFVLRNYVLGTGVEMTFPLYSPMVKRIKVLKGVRGAVDGDDMLYIRDEPAKAPFSFSMIDEMLIRHREYERKLSDK
ncbi:translation protein SH3-like domain-containing protein [Polychytrium aggregatum]|uniref:translation protein SH3-like domain-containing protein n=1 Tax=Polychytrium aggregatum TaxID=110093 RepID=UPI0022FE93E5|nr:translation protein SH3-like domain-containing protein [Polychytrium aggregatum]KAI9208213.1 translation protein SH3-like domain-containing protein [Polychytrium aggregatum]